MKIKIIFKRIFLNKHIKNILEKYIRKIFLKEYFLKEFIKRIH